MASEYITLWWCIQSEECTRESDPTYERLLPTYYRGQREEQDGNIYGTSEVPCVSCKKEIDKKREMKMKMIKEKRIAKEIITRRKKRSIL